MLPGRQMLVPVKTVNFLFLINPSQFIFFTGKGGVGKTSLSCASAIKLADGGQKVLLVSTDPASNLNQVLGTSIESSPVPVNGVENLWALDINPRKAALDYRQRVVEPYRGVLPDETVAEIEEKLSGACTMEIAAFDEFSKLLTDEGILSNYDHVIFDTAPTGHTLRLLSLSSAWKGYLDSSGGTASCLGPLSGLKGHYEQFKSTLGALSDPDKTRLVLVMRPDRHSIKEAERTSFELNDIGIKNQFIAINGILDAGLSDDRTAYEISKKQTAALENLPFNLAEKPRTDILLSPICPVGVAGLRNFLTPDLFTISQNSDSFNKNAIDGIKTFEALVNDIKSNGSGIVMVMGKGGVGKTSIASMLAVEAAKSGLKVHLSTSDPAAHLDGSLNGLHGNLKVSRIDPAAETSTYVKEVMTTMGATLDEEGRKLLNEDLQSPCTEEVAVFRAFAKIVDEAEKSLVILDTAPTGHTLLLLDASEAYHREVARNASETPVYIKRLLPRLKDPQYSKIIIVTLPEATPVQEASELDDDLKRAGIKPFAWVINQSLSPLFVSHPTLKARRIQEEPYIGAVKKICQNAFIAGWRGDL